MKIEVKAQAKSSRQRPNTLRVWQRVLLLIVLAYEGAGGILGGILLVNAPDGRLMQMPTAIMHGVFTDFFIPGIILLGMGILNSMAFIAVLRKSQSAWLLASLAMGGYLIWFTVEIAILEELHWLHAMWGLPVLLGGWAALPMIPPRQETLRKTFIACGILASFFYVVLNLIVPGHWPGYDSAAQTISELSAVDAPTRQLWVISSLPYTFLMLLFSWGVLRSGAQNKTLRTVGVLLLIYSTLGIFWPFAPMHLRPVLAAGGGTISDTIHLVFGAFTELIFFLALGFSAFAFGKLFRLYSAVTLLVILVFGVLTFIDAPGVAANRPTPFIGVWERINVGVFLLWVVVLAGSLLRKKDPHDSFADLRRTPFVSVQNLN